MVGEYVSFINLVVTIAAELNIDDSRNKFEIRYIIDGNFSPSTIRTDMEARLYVEVKKHEIGLGTYPFVLIQFIRMLAILIVLMYQLVQLYVFKVINMIHSL